MGKDPDQIPHLEDERGLNVEQRLKRLGTILAHIIPDKECP